MHQLHPDLLGSIEWCTLAFVVTHRGGYRRIRPVAWGGDPGLLGVDAQIAGAER